MALVDLWKNATETIRDKHIQQIISFAGSGKLVDGSDTSTEFRTYLSFVPSVVLARYAMECLSSSFDQSGFALQDIVNQIGQRLTFTVTNGNYRGTKGLIGFDGIWHSSRGDDLVVEVKTTDAYRIDLNTLASYRAHLIKQTRISPDMSSILIVVGRQDTGDLEAQIRGSRHAWDIRLISVEALIRLMLLHESVDDPLVMRKICTLLTPQEFTKVDGIIDLVFSTAEDIQAIIPDENPVDTRHTDGILSAPALPLPQVELLTPSAERQQQGTFHTQCIKRISQHLQMDVIKMSRSMYRSADHTIALSCATSREYDRPNSQGYWFAFHPYQQQHLNTAQTSFAAFGCGSASHIFLIPRDIIEQWLPGLNQTVRENTHYWHIQILCTRNYWTIQRRTGFDHIEISKYLI